jgi:adenosylcobinamide-phosphate synthase
MVTFRRCRAPSPRRNGRTVLPNPLAAALGIMADAVMGEPPASVHPVRMFGTSMQRVEHVLYRDTRGAGAVHALTGTTLGVGAGASVGSTAVATYLAVAGRALGTIALEVRDTLGSSDLERARALLPSLVGRDPSGLDREDVARAVVESVAENTVDAVVAPAVWAAAAGAPGALGYRALNTLDSMVGHRSPRYERFGWASARLDDAAAYLPARLTAVLVAAVRPRAAVEIWRAVHLQAPLHPSPNAGVAEAAFAAALGIRLGGTNRYGDETEHRPALGRGRPPEVTDIARAVQLSDAVTTALVALLTGVGLVSAIVDSRKRRRMR